MVKVFFTPKLHSASLTPLQLPILHFSISHCLAWIVDVLFIPLSLWSLQLFFQRPSPLCSKFPAVNTAIISSPHFLFIIILFHLSGPALPPRLSRLCVCMLRLIRTSYYIVCLFLSLPLSLFGSRLFPSFSLSCRPPLLLHLASVPPSLPSFLSSCADFRLACIYVYTLVASPPRQ